MVSRIIRHTPLLYHTKFFYQKPLNHLIGLQYLTSLFAMSHTNSPAIQTAGCLIIGDEVLNGKILDTNSHYFSKHCFNKLSIPVKKTIVCGDDKEDIKLSLQTLMESCDFIVTSGGIGPTHDDITYESISDTFQVDCELDEETVERMNRLRKDYVSKLSPRQLEAFYKMATFPVDKTGNVKTERIFIDETLWVPIVGVQGRVYILPGVPQLFKKLLDGLEPYIRPRIDKELSLKRYYVKTSTKESDLAPYLTDLQDKCNNQFGASNIKLGSYPHISWKTNTISIIGNEKVKDQDLRLIVSDVVDNIEGNAKEITIEEEDLMTTTDPK